MCLSSLLSVPLNRQDPRDYFNMHHADLNGSHNLLYTHFVLSEIKFCAFPCHEVSVCPFMHGFCFPLGDCKYCAVLTGRAWFSCCVPSTHNSLLRYSDESHGVEPESAPSHSVPAYRRIQSLCPQHRECCGVPSLGPQRPEQGLSQARPGQCLDGC